MMNRSFAQIVSSPRVIDDGVFVLAGPEYKHQKKVPRGLYVVSFGCWF